MSHRLASSPDKVAATLDRPCVRGRLSSSCPSVELWFRRTKFGSDHVIDGPLRWIPIGQHFFGRLVKLLDAFPTAQPFNVRMCKPRVLADFAKEVLAVDELQRTAPQRLERDAQALEFDQLPVGYEPD